MARLIVMVFVPLLLAGVVLHRWLKARRFGLVEDSLASFLAPAFIIRCRDDFCLLDARRAPLSPYLCGHTIKTYPAEGVWYALYANGPGDEERPPARLVVLAALTPKTLPWASDTATGVTVLSHGTCRSGNSEGKFTTLVLTSHTDPWLNPDETFPWNHGSVACRMVFLTRKNTLKIMVEYREPDRMPDSERLISENSAELEAFAHRACAAFRILPLDAATPLPGLQRLLPPPPPEVRQDLLPHMVGDVVRKRGLRDYLFYFIDDIAEILAYFRR